MSKPKTPRSPTPQKPVVDPAALVADTAPTQLSSDDWLLISKSSTFLYRIPGHAGQARLHGYDEEEHEQGKRLVDVASGRNRTLDHWMAEHTAAAQPSEYNAEQMRLLQDVDAFENMWFPRVRTILQRCIPADRIVTFLAVFFKDLTQQPLGRSVLDSTSLLISRFEQLATSSEPGAKAAHALGVKRGLTTKKIAHVRSLIAAAQASLPKAAPAPAVPAATLAKARQEQLEALRELRLWYNDWAATFRGVFGTRVLIQLGLASQKRGAPAVEEGEEEGADEEAEGEETEPEGEEEAVEDGDDEEEAVEAPKPAKGKATPAAKKGGKVGK